jgi:replicative DNA helicase Mcm
MLRKLTEKEKELLSKLAPLVAKKRLNLVKKLLKQKKISIIEDRLDISITESPAFPQIRAEHEEIDAADANKDIKDKIRQELFKNFSKQAFEKIPHYIAPNISGMHQIKQAAALQLFSSQAIHILLLGDPGTGKTDIIRSTAELSPISSFGLGSGTSGAGLVITAKGNEVIKGLLPQADKGLCAIDELNLMKKEDYAGLYNAMEKGFVTYDKAGKHYKFDARIKVLATANPKGDTFTGSTIEELKKELPFDSALLTRFHLLFMIRKPDLQRFREIASSILSEQKQTKSKPGDMEFIKAYLGHVQNIDKVSFSKANQLRVLDFVEELKKNEKNYLVEISPRLVIGIMRLCKALARMEARHEVNKEDIERVKEIMLSSLRISTKFK